MARSRFPSLLFIAIALLALFGMALVDAKKKKKKNNRKKVKGQVALSCDNYEVEDCAAYQDDCKSCALCTSGYTVSTDGQDCCKNSQGCLDYEAKSCQCTHCMSEYRLQGGHCVSCPDIKNCEAGAYDHDCRCNWCNHNNYLMPDGTCSDCPEVAGCQEYKENSCECKTKA